MTLAICARWACTASDIEASNIFHTVEPREPIRMECFLTRDLTRRLRFIASNKAPNRWAVTGFRRLEGMPGLILHFPAVVSTHAKRVWGNKSSNWGMRRCITTLTLVK
jgi:hypothetical protein